MDILLSSVSQGLLWSIMAVGVYITFRLLDIPDLTAEGSFPLGAAICAISLVNGMNPFLATFLGMLGGLVIGVVSGLLHTKMKIPALLKEKTLVTMLQGLGIPKVYAVILLGLVFSLVLIVLLTIFLKTEVGLAILSTGDNEDMSAANGIRIDNMKILGYMISNGFIALSGALLAQNNGFADLNMGVGTIVIGLASIIIAEVVIKNLSLGKRIASIIIGSIIYRLVISLVLEIPGMDTQLVKLFSAIILAIILFIPELEKKFPKGVRR